MRDVAVVSFAQSQRELVMGKFRSRAVAKNAHGLDPGHARRVKRLPRAAALEKRSDAGADRVDAAIPARDARGALRRLRFDHRHVESGRVERQRKARADQTAADHNHVKIHISSTFEA